jgi:hypothetical protein
MVCAGLRSAHPRSTHATDRVPVRADVPGFLPIDLIADAAVRRDRLKGRYEDRACRLVENPEGGTRGASKGYRSSVASPSIGTGPASPTITVLLAGSTVTDSTYPRFVETPGPSIVPEHDRTTLAEARPQVAIVASAAAATLVDILAFPPRRVGKELDPVSLAQIAQPWPCCCPSATSTTRSSRPERATFAPSRGTRSEQSDLTPRARSADSAPRWRDTREPAY